MFTDGGLFLFKDILLIILSLACAGMILWNVLSRSKTRKTLEENEKLIEKSRSAGEEAIKEARAKTEFVASMSHEIRTPVNAINSATELLLRENLPGAARSYLGILKSSSDALVDLTNDFLDYSKMDAGKFSLIENEYALRSVMEDVKSIICAKIDDENVTFLIDIDPTIPSTLLGDEVRIKQMLINMLNNAVKYTVNGEISLHIFYDRISSDSVDVTFEVRDTGCGIAPAQKEELTRFFESGESGTLKVSGEGRGLGLSVCRQLTSLMGGKMEVESELGSGSVFRATFRQNLLKDVLPVSDIDISRHFSLDFIVWDDSRSSRENIYSILSDLGVPAKTVENSSEMESVLSTVKIDYVITTENHFSETVNLINRHSPTTIPVKLVEIGEAADTSFDGNFATIKRPVDVFGVLDVIEAKELLSKHEAEHGGKMMAPEAKILLVDDNRVNLKVAKALLETFSSKVVAVDSGFEAVEIVKLGEKFDLIFMDHMMPGMDGVEASGKIWEIEGQARTPVIALTANAGGEIEKLFFDAGMSDFIPKPIVMKHLNYVLQKWLPKEKQIFSEKDNLSAKHRDERIKAKAFRADWGLSKIWNDEKIFFEVLHVYMDNAPALIDTIAADESLETRLEAAKLLLKYSASAGAVRLPDILREMINIGELGEEKLFTAKTEYLVEECKLLSADVAQYLQKEEPVIDIMEGLTFE